MLPAQQGLLTNHGCFSPSIKLDFEDDLTVAFTFILTSAYEATIKGLGKEMREGLLPDSHILPTILRLWFGNMGNMGGGASRILDWRH